MGASHSVELYPDQESPTDPGARSVISASLDALDPPVSNEAFLNELVEYMRWPIDPTTEALLKECTVKENGPNDFTVKVLVDGVKLDSYGFGKGDGTDRIRTWKRVVFDKAEKTVITHDYVPEHALGAWVGEASEKETNATCYLKSLADPSRLEIYAILADGERLSNENLANSLYTWTDLIIGQLHAAAKAKVKVQVGKSISDPTVEAAVSEPLDEHTDYDTLFDGIVSMVRSKIEKIPGIRMEDFSETEFLGIHTHQDADGKENETTHVVKFDKDSGDMSFVTKDRAGRIMTQSLKKMHKSPLVVEAWNVGVNGERTAGQAFAKQTQKDLNEILEKSSGGLLATAGSMLKGLW